jgi:membrane protein DedA with SNARE-associated domain
VQHFITQYGYLAVFLLMLAESACIPVPSEVVMLLGGALAAGAVPGAHPALVGVIAAGVLGNVAGSYLAWAAGKYAGRPAVRRWGRRFGIREHDIDRATAWFERRGPAAVFLGRLVPVVRTFISLPAGFAGMPPGRFGLYTTLGCIPWTAALGVAGYALGANWQNVASGFHGPTYVIAGLIVAALAAAVALRLRRRHRRGGDGGRDRVSENGGGRDGGGEKASGRDRVGENASGPDRVGENGGGPDRVSENASGRDGGGADGTGADHGRGEHALTPPPAPGTAARTRRTAPPRSAEDRPPGDW